MRITKENTGELTATIRLEIVPEDYSEAVNKVIKDYQKKANIPGFRPGHVPAGLIRKMYGKALMAEEVNKIISDSITGFIKEQKIEMLGNPIPNQEKNSAVNFDTQTSFDFYFDIGYAPEFSVPLGTETEVTDYEINVTEDMIEKYIADSRKNFGTLKPAEIPEETVAEPEKTGQTETPADETETGKEFPEAGDTPEKQTPDVIPAEMTPEFFKKVYPGEDIATEEQFRERIRRDASASFTSETDKFFFNLAIETLVKKTEIVLPDEFLKRWLVEYHEGKFTSEDIEKDYISFRESMKWQLIENKIIRENDIRITDEDIRSYIQTVMLRRVGTEFVDPEMEKKYDSIVDAFMQNKEQVKRISDQLYNARLLGIFKTKLKISKKEVSYEEFAKIASEVAGHEHE